jgi:hypothetical protein
VQSDNSQPGVNKGKLRDLLTSQRAQQGRSGKPSCSVAGVCCGYYEKGRRDG